MLGWLKTRTLRRIPGNTAEGPAESAPAPAATKPAVQSGEAAIEYIRRGQFHQARDALREAIRRDPGNATHRVNLAYALQQCGEADEARIHLQEAVVLAPESFDAHYMLAGSSEAAGDLEGAARSLRRAVEVNDGFEAAQVDLCRILAQLPAARSEAQLC